MNCSWALVIRPSAADGGSGRSSTRTNKPKAPRMTTANSAPGDSPRTHRPTAPSALHLPQSGSAGFVRSVPGITRTKPLRAPNNGWRGASGGERSAVRRRGRIRRTIKHHVASTKSGMGFMLASIILRHRTVNRGNGRPMGMKQTLDVIARMEADGVIGRYAIAGAVAAYNYIEPAVTEDVDILIAFDSDARPPPSGLVTLEPILAYLKDKGYSDFRKEGFLIEGWAVQFIPVASDLDAEALAKADDIDLAMRPNDGPVKTRVLRPEHLVAMALRVGRPRDRLRIAQFLEE